ncbi:MAG: hypothetical protein OXJ53_00240 [Gammaproteobacteria bacterium]|nr:hypothetical protein [Gammaproteobacteria bacterium]MDE0273466.1 hypothetical protein [Gammaproteobacteria bacterium]
MPNSTRIGELNERSLHRALKALYATPGSLSEQLIDGYVVDVLIGQRIIEIHTGGFSRLKRKLPRLLKNHALTLVHPIAQDRFIVKQGAGGAATRRKSPKHGSLFSIFSGLTSIPTLVAHPNFALEAVITVEEEVRVPDPRRNRRRGGWTAIDRRLVEVLETHRIESMGDLFAPLDAHLPEEFTTADLASAMQAPRRLGQQAAFCLREAGVVAICGKDGNALRYRRCEN